MKKDSFTQTIFRRMWMPAIVSAAGLAFADMADAIVVGQQMGATGLAAISLCLPLYMVMNVIMHGVGLGGSTTYAKLMGEGSWQEAEKVFNDCIKTALAVGIGLAVLGNALLTPLLALLGTRPGDGALFQAAKDYAGIIIWGIPLFFLDYIINYFLRNDDREKLASFGYTTANVCDLGLNILFVLVFRWGAKGAAISTVIGQAIAVGIYMIGLKDKDNHLKLTKGWMDWKNAYGQFKSGFAVSVQYVYTFFFLMVVNNFLIRYSGESGVAVFDLIQNVSYLILYLYDSATKAMQPLVSTYMGECNEKGVKEAKRVGLTAGCALGGALIVLIMVFPGSMCWLFGLEDPGMTALAYSALRIYCVSAFFAGINTYLENFEECCERERNAFTMVTLRGVAVLFPCVLIFASMGMEAIWLFYPVTEIVSLAVFLFWKKRYGMPEKMRSDKVFTYTISNTSQEISDLSERCSEFCEENGIPMKKAYFVAVSVEELCVAVMKNGFSKEGEGFIQLTVVAMENGNVDIFLRDNADRFDPFSMESKEEDEGFALDTMGIDIIRKRAKEFYYRHYQGFNTLIVKT